ncbi:diaminopropionate ammonia-lyase [Alphaproteobacteria bacterium HT1-32]|nr:diaminopropionate ammonia-lyase [Alphaproteobacteria bacterium HT1-32]
MSNKTRLKPNSPARRFRSDASRPLAMLKQCPVYQPTPCMTVAGLAADCGVAELYVKDESRRMRLGSFKALGGAFAVAQMISDATGETDLMSDSARQKASEMTFITASAGNHGLSVAAGARVFGARAVVVLAPTVPEGFADRIRSLNAEVVRTKGTYEDSVAYARKAADENDWLHLADGSWDGYTERPALVMEGYTVLADECRQMFAEQGRWPTHVFLQAGVGGFAAAIAANIRDFWDEQPVIIVVEPDAAPCIRASVEADRLTRADGPVSNMGRLDCKDASLIAFESLRHDADIFMTVTEDEATAAVARYRRHGILTTESGGAPLAAVSHAGLPADSRCLLMVTEGPEEG